MPLLPVNLARVLKASPPEVIFVPGSFFFTRRVPLPPSIQPAEVEGFVELTLEGLSPFPIDQLNFGHVVAEAGDAVFIYAAYRRRFAAETTRNWPEVAYVVPAFLPFLRETHEADSTVVLESGGELTAMSFKAGRQLPERVTSRPIPETENEELRKGWLEKTRAAFLAGEPGFENEIHHAGTWAVEEATSNLSFELRPGDESDEPVETRSVPVSDLWAMDIRDRDFVRSRKQAVRIDGFMWRGILGIAAALMILIAGETLLIGGRVFLSVMGDIIAKRENEVVRIEERHGIVTRLAEFDRSNLIPFEMIQAIVPLKPRSVYFTSAKTEGHNSMIIDANTMNVADVNEFESALRGLNEVQSVEVRNLKSREDGTSFTLVLSFVPGIFERIEENSPLQTASR
jgi:hypothetical protein